MAASARVAPGLAVRPGVQVGDRVRTHLDVCLRRDLALESPTSGTVQWQIAGVRLPVGVEDVALRMLAEPVHVALVVVLEWDRQSHNMGS